MYVLQCRAKVRGHRIILEDDSSKVRLGRIWLIHVNTAEKKYKNAGSLSAFAPFVTKWRLDAEWSQSAEEQSKNITGSISLADLGHAVASFSGSSLAQKSQADVMLSVPSCTIPT